MISCGVRLDKEPIRTAEETSIGQQLCGRTGQTGGSAMIQCRRLAYAVLATTDIDKQVRYYEHVLGLRRAGSDGTRTVLSTAHGVECLVLERGERAALTGLSFEISPRVSLEEAKSVLERRDIKATIRPART